MAAAYRGALWAAGVELTSDRQPDGSPKAILRQPMDVLVSSKDFASSKRLLKEVGEACADLSRLGPDFEPDVSATTIKLRNGSTIEAVACSDKAIRGPTAGVIADEFAFWRHQEDCWAAIKSVTDPTLKSERGQPGLFVTSAWDSSSLAFRIFTDDAFPFRRHSVNIYEAVADGFPINPEEAFRELGIPELIDSEYLCRWSRGGESFFGLDKLRDCVVDDERDRGGATINLALPRDFKRAPLYVGIDIGGGKGRDNTAIVLWRLIGDQCWMTAVKAFNRLEPVDQWDEVEKLIRDNADESLRVVIAVDAGYDGGPMVSVLRQRFRSWKRLQFAALSMNPADQERYAKAMRHALDHHRVKLYAGTEAGGDEGGAHALMLELSALKTRPGIGGKLTFATPRDSTKGHCDRAWAAMFGISKIQGVSAPSFTNSQPDPTTDPEAHVQHYHSPLNF